MEQPGDAKVVSNPTVLAQLIEQALAAIDRREPVDIAKLCANHPELQDAVAVSLRRAASFSQLHRQASEIDGAVGSVFAGRYRLEQRIGAGAMGVVYQAVDQQLGRAVAVKVLRPELVVGAKMDQRLAREGQVLATIRHRNVVTVHDSGSAADGRAFLVMEQLHGQSLSQLLRSEAEAKHLPNAADRIAGFRAQLGDHLPLVDNDVRQVVLWVIEAASGMQAAHDAGVVHRDVKPSNLFLERDGRLVVLDFGIVSGGSHATLTGDGSPMGTPAYMAPEQLDPAVKPDARTDVYGLAATLYHLLTGRAPFAGSIQQVLDAVARREPEAADRVRPGLPVDLVAIVEKGMSKVPAQRYGSADAFRQDLLAWLDYRPVSARRVSWLTARVRKAYRSPGVRAAALMLGLCAGALAWWQLDAAREAKVAERIARDLWPRIPPSLINDLPHYRATSALRTDATLVHLLDELVAISPDPGTALGLRVIHRSDGADFAGAAEDAQRIADLGDAPFALTAAMAYRAGHPPDDLAQGEATPACGGANDRFLVALHAMRSTGARPLWLEELLDRDHGLTERIGFAELQLLLQQRRALALEDADLQVRTLERLEREAALLAERRGQPTAISLHVQAGSLILQGRPQEAEAIAARYRQLVPGDACSWNVSGSAAMRCGKPEEAVTMYRQAIKMQPSSLHNHAMLCDAYIETGKFGDAEALLSAVPFATASGATTRMDQMGRILFGRALTLRAAPGSRTEEGEAEIRKLFAASRDLFRRLRHGTDADPSLEELACEAELGEPFVAARLLALMARRPTDGCMLNHVASLLPATLAETDVDSLRTLLRAQAMVLVGRER
jgi:tetratricopeptide (TPR) repeat protein